MDVLDRELLVISNKARYIQEILNDTIDLRRKRKEQVIEILCSKEYSIVDDDAEYKYLTKMSMDSVTEENVAKIMNERDKKAGELEAIKSKPIVVMWEEELVALESEYLKYRSERNVVEVVKPSKKAGIKRK